MNWHLTINGASHSIGTTHDVVGCYPATDVSAESIVVSEEALTAVGWDRSADPDFETIRRAHREVILRALVAEEETLQALIAEEEAEEDAADKALVTLLEEQPASGHPFVYVLVRRSLSRSPMPDVEITLTERAIVGLLKAVR